MPTSSLRIALPGYNAKTDTNPDHFALYADQDWVLIKEKLRGSVSIAQNGESIIDHGLGYVPFFLVYAFDTADNKWKLIPHYQGGFIAPPYAAYSDTTTLHMVNNDATTDFKYYIFYDNIVGNKANSIDLRGATLSIAKSGINALTENDPNNFIFHSNFNTFKILKEGTATITYSSDGAYTISHGLSSYTATSCLIFIKFPDGYTALIPGSGTCASKNKEFAAENAFVDSTNININLRRLSGSATALSIKYYIFETPLV